MKIKQSELKKIISEEITRNAGLDQAGSPSTEDILIALELLSEANPVDLSQEVEILEELLRRAKNN